MKTLDALLPSNAGERRTLADIIFAKLESGETEKSTVIQKTHRGTEMVYLQLRPTRSLFFKTQEKRLILQQASIRRW